MNKKQLISKISKIRKLELKNHRIQEEKQADILKWAEEFLNLQPNREEFIAFFNHLHFPSAMLYLIWSTKKESR